MFTSSMLPFYSSKHQLCVSLSQKAVITWILHRLGQRTSKDEDYSNYITKQKPRFRLCRKAAESEEKNKKKKGYLESTAAKNKTEEEAIHKTRQANNCSYVSSTSNGFYTSCGEKQRTVHTAKSLPKGHLSSESYLDVWGSSFREDAGGAG